MEQQKEQLKAVAKRMQSLSMELRKVRDEFNELYDNLPKTYEGSRLKHLLTESSEYQFFAGDSLCDSYCDILEGLGWPKI